MSILQDRATLIKRHEDLITMVCKARLSQSQTDSLFNKMKTVVAQINETFRTEHNQRVIDYYNNNL